MVKRMYNIITSVIADNPRANPPVPAMEARQTTGATFQINNAKLYVPIVRKYKERI